MKKYKVIHIIHNLEIGGVEAAVLSSLEDLCKSFDFTLVCVGSIKPSVLSKIPDNCSNNIIQVNSFSGFYKCITILNKAYPYQVIISSLWKSHLLHLVLKIFLKNKKSIIFLHSGKFAHIFDKFSILFSTHFCNEIWTDSQSTSNFIKSYSKKNNIQKISFLLQHFTTKPQNIPKQYPIKFIFLGRLSEVKRLDLIVKFIYELKLQNLDITLDIFGPDNQVWDPLETQIKSLKLNDIIQYKGICPIDETQNLLSQYDAFVLMSDYEGMSISTVQAMETGLLCFLRSVGEIANYGEDMVNSIILKSENPSDWQTFIKNSVHVLTNETLQKSIISNSTAKFANQLTYTQDVIQNLKRLSSQS